MGGSIGRIVRGVMAVAGGLALAAAPSALWAAEGGRALERPEDALPVALLTAAAVLGVFLVATIGYLYRRQRTLDWDFQQPDAPHDDHH